MRIFVFLVALFYAGGAFANSLPEPDYASLKIGATFVYERTDGTRYQSKLLSAGPDGYVFENRNNEDGSGSFISKSTFNQDGKRTIWQGPEETWVFKPHGCNRVLGDCTYKSQRSSGGKSYRNTVSAKMTDGRVTWKRYYEGQVVGSGWFELDPVTHWMSSYKWSNSRGGGETAKLLRIDQP